MKKRSIITPDFSVEPTISSIRSAAVTTNMTLDLYESKDGQPYRMASLYHVSIRKSGSETMMSRSDLQTLQELLQQAWTDTVTSKKDYHSVYILVFFKYKLIKVEDKTSLFKMVLLCCVDNLEHIVFIRPSSDGTYYGMVMSVRPSVTVFCTFLLHALRY